MPKMKVVYQGWMIDPDVLRDPDLREVAECLGECGKASMMAASALLQRAGAVAADTSMLGAGLGREVVGMMRTAASLLQDSESANLAAAECWQELALRVGKRFNAVCTMSGAEEGGGSDA